MRRSDEDRYAATWVESAKIRQVSLICLLFQPFFFLNVVLRVLGHVSTLRFVFLLPRHDDPIFRLATALKPDEEATTTKKVLTMPETRISRKARHYEASPEIQAEIKALSVQEKTSSRKRRRLKRDPDPPPPEDTSEDEPESKVKAEVKGEVKPEVKSEASPAGAAEAVGSSSAFVSPQSLGLDLQHISPGVPFNPMLQTPFTGLPWMMPNMGLMPSPLHDPLLMQAQMLTQGVLPGFGSQAPSSTSMAALVNSAPASLGACSSATAVAAPNHGVNHVTHPGKRSRKLKRKSPGSKSHKVKKDDVVVPNPVTLEHSYTMPPEAMNKRRSTHAQLSPGSGDLDPSDVSVNGLDPWAEAAVHAAMHSETNEASVEKKSSRRCPTIKRLLEKSSRTSTHAHPDPHPDPDHVAHTHSAPNSTSQPGISPFGHVPTATHVTASHRGTLSTGRIWQPPVAELSPPSSTVAPKREAEEPGSPKKEPGSPRKEPGSPRKTMTLSVPSIMHAIEMVKMQQQAMTSREKHVVKHVTGSDPGAPSSSRDPGAPMSPVHHVTSPTHHVEFDSGSEAALPPMPPLVRASDLLLTSQHTALPHTTKEERDWVPSVKHEDGESGRRVHQAFQHGASSQTVASVPTPISKMASLSKNQVQRSSAVAVKSEPEVDQRVHSEAAAHTSGGNPGTCSSEEKSEPVSPKKEPSVESTHPESHTVETGEEKPLKHELELKKEESEGGVAVDEASEKSEQRSESLEARASDTEDVRDRVNEETPRLTAPGSPGDSPQDPRAAESVLSAESLQHALAQLCSVTSVAIPPQVADLSLCPGQETPPESGETPAEGVAAPSASGEAPSEGNATRMRSEEHDEGVPKVETDMPKTEQNLPKLDAEDPVRNTDGTHTPSGKPHASKAVVSPTPTSKPELAAAVASDPPVAPSTTAASPLSKSSPAKSPHSSDVIRMLKLARPQLSRIASPLKGAFGPQGPPPGPALRSPGPGLGPALPCPSTSPAFPSPSLGPSLPSAAPGSSLPISSSGPSTPCSSPGLSLPSPTAGPSLHPTNSGPTLPGPRGPPLPGPDPSPPHPGQPHHSSRQPGPTLPGPGQVTPPHPSSPGTTQPAVSTAIDTVPVGSAPTPSAAQSVNTSDVRSANTSDHSEEREELRSTSESVDSRLIPPGSDTTLSAKVEPRSADPGTSTPPLTVDAKQTGSDLGEKQFPPEHLGSGLAHGRPSSSGASPVVHPASPVKGPRDLPVLSLGQSQNPPVESGNQSRDSPVGSLSQSRAPPAETLSPHRVASRSSSSSSTTAQTAVLPESPGITSVASAFTSPVASRRQPQSQSSSSQVPRTGSSPTKSPTKSPKILSPSRDPGRSPQQVRSPNSSPVKRRTQQHPGHSPTTSHTGTPSVSSVQNFMHSPEAMMAQANMLASAQLSQAFMESMNAHALMSQMALAQLTAFQNPGAMNPFLNPFLQDPSALALLSQAQYAQSLGLSLGGVPGLPMVNPAFPGQPFNPALMGVVPNAAASNNPSSATAKSSQESQPKAESSSSRTKQKPTESQKSGRKESHAQVSASAATKTASPTSVSGESAQSAQTPTTSGPGSTSGSRRTGTSGSGSKRAEANAPPSSDSGTDSPREGAAVAAADAAGADALPAAVRMRVRAESQDSSGATSDDSPASTPTTASVPGWFGKGLNVRKGKRKRAKYT